MTSDLIGRLACPVDRATPLTLATTAAPPGPIESGCLTCPACGREYPIEAGIPRLLPDRTVLAPEEARDKERERDRRDQEAGIYDRNRALRVLGAFEIPATLRRLQPSPQDTVLEVGCGTGRFTRHLARCGARVVAVDFSFASLQIARRKVPEAHIDFIQADASYLPLTDGTATKALTCQMLEHLPTPEARERALAGIARVLQPHGELVASAYWYSPFARWLGDRQGYHSEAIYYYRFDRREFHALLDPWFEVDSLTGALIYILLARGSRRARLGHV
jgi:SAM-dependent methyltransferase